MPSLAFLPSSPLCSPPPPTSRHTCPPHPPRCTAQPPKDPSNLRTESERRRNQPPKPLRRRKRRITSEPVIDWDALPSVPLVRPQASPESGEDYWFDIDADRMADAVGPAASAVDADAADPAVDAMAAKKEKKEIDDRLRERLKEEVVSPYTQNWILRFAVVVVVLVLLVAIFGGEENVPIIRVPDL